MPPFSVLRHMSLLSVLILISLSFELKSQYYLYLLSSSTSLNITPPMCKSPFTRRVTSWGKSVTVIDRFHDPSTTYPPAIILKRPSVLKTKSKISSKTWLFLALPTRPRPVFTNCCRIPSDSRDGPNCHRFSDQTSYIQIAKLIDNSA